MHGGIIRDFGQLVGKKTIRWISVDLIRRSSRAERGTSMSCEPTTDIVPARSARTTAARELRTGQNVCIVGYYDEICLFLIIRGAIPIILEINICLGIAGIPIDIFHAITLAYMDNVDDTGKLA
jgi:hypothetical protein